MLLIQYRQTEHMHEGVWFRKNNFCKNDIYENLDYFSDISFDKLSFQAWIILCISS